MVCTRGVGLQQRLQAGIHGRGESRRVMAPRSVRIMMAPRTGISQRRIRASTRGASDPGGGIVRGRADRGHPPRGVPGSSCRSRQRPTGPGHGFRTAGSLRICGRVNRLSCSGHGHGTACHRCLWRCRGGEDGVREGLHGHRLRNGSGFLRWDKPSDPPGAGIHAAWHGPGPRCFSEKDRLIPGEPPVSRGQDRLPCRSSFGWTRSSPGGQFRKERTLSSMCGVDSPRRAAVAAT